MEALRRIRRERGLSQVELSKRTGVAQSTISEIEKGEREAQVRTVRKLADTLGVKVDDLLGDPEPVAMGIARRNAESIEHFIERFERLKDPEGAVAIGVQIASDSMASLVHALASGEIPQTSRWMRETAVLHGRLADASQELAKRWQERHHPTTLDPEVQELRDKARELEVNVPSA